jgi:hypothetical protein
MPSCRVEPRRIISLALFAAVAPLILRASPVYFIPGTVSFNGSSPGTLTLGNDNCTPDPGTCTLSVTEGGTPVGAITLSLTMPNLPTSPFSYSGDPSPITTSGSPATSVSLSDSSGDFAMGTFVLTNLLPDGATGTNGFPGVDIDGSITINSITPGTNIASFDSLFGLPSASPLSFTLDVGNCTSGSKAKPCIDATDPTAQFISLDLDPGSPSAAPEPGTLELLGCGLGLIFVARRWRRPRDHKALRRLAACGRSDGLWKAGQAD